MNHPSRDPDRAYRVRLVIIDEGGVTTYELSVYPSNFSEDGWEQFVRDMLAMHPSGAVAQVTA